MSLTYREWGPAQCKILDSLCPNEPKGKNPADIYSHNLYSQFFGLPGKNQSAYHPLKLSKV